MKTNLAIISIAVCFLGGIQCITVKDFRKLQEAKVTKNEISATVFVTDHFVTKNRFCFMMFLRDIVLTEDIVKKGIQSGFAYYGNPFLISLYLLNNDVFHTHYGAINKILNNLKEWDSTSKPKQLKENIRTLIEKGEAYNMWYMDKGIVTERDQDNFQLGITKESSYFQTCYDLYEDLARDSYIILNILERSLPPNKIDARTKIFRSIPLLMYRDDTYKKHNLLTTPYANDTEFQNLLTNVLAFYKTKIVSFVYHSITLIIDVVALDFKPLKEGIKKKEEAKTQRKTYMVITDKIMKSVNFMVLRYNRLLSYSTNKIMNNYTLKPKHWSELQNCYTRIRTQITNEEVGTFNAHEIEMFSNPWYDHEQIDKLDSYPSLLMYYPKYGLIKNKIDNNLSFKRLLNLQAWSAILPSYMDALITAIESAGYRSRTNEEPEE